MGETSVFAEATGAWWCGGGAVGALRNCLHYCQPKDGNFCSHHRSRWQGGRSGVGGRQAEPGTGNQRNGREGGLCRPSPSVHQGSVTTSSSLVNAGEISHDWRSSIRSSKLSSCRDGATDAPGRGEQGVVVVVVVHSLSSESNTTTPRTGTRARRRETKGGSTVFLFLLLVWRCASCRPGTSAAQHSAPVEVVSKQRGKDGGTAEQRRSSA